LSPHNILSKKENMGALCSSAQASETQGRASPASAPVANPAASGGGVGGDGGRSSTTAAVPASAGIAQPSDGTVIIDHATAHLENNEADGGALEVYLDDDLGGGYQARAGQSADPLGTKRRPSMIIPAGHEFEPSLDPDAVTLGATIGSGSFGKVVHGHYQGFHIAIKQCFVPRDPKQLKEVIMDFKREVKLLQAINHPRVLRFVSACAVMRTRQFWIATEIMVGSVGTLLKMIHYAGGSHKLSWRLVLQIAIDAAEGMAFLHGLSVPIIHRDLKAENLLLDEDFRCKLADFGLARTIDKGATMTICGTPSWIAPEVFRGDHYDKTVDVYSFAVVIWELFCQEKPYKGIEVARIPRRVTNEGLRPRVPEHCPPAIQKLLPEMWHKDASRRPHFPEIETRLGEAMKEVDLDAGVDPKKKWERQ
jgi:hypothetical protein